MAGGVLLSASSFDTIRRQIRSTTIAPSVQLTNQHTTGTTSHLVVCDNVQYYYCMKTITINVSEPVYEEFREYSRRTDRSISEIIRQAMEEFSNQRVRRAGSMKDIPPLSVGAMIRDIGPSDDTLSEMLDDLRD